MANYDDMKKDELLKEAQKRDLSGRSGMDRDELQAALEADDNASDEGSDNEVDGTKPETQVGFDSEASDPDVVGDEVAGQEALAEMEPEQAAQADLALDASGPLVLDKPSNRIMAGATSEAEAKEQEKLLSDLPEDFVGNVLGDGSVATNSAREGSGENGEVLQEDVIDFPPPPAEVTEERKNLVEGKAENLSSADYAKTRAANEAFPDEGEVVAQPRLYQQRGQLYTDGLSGQADHNLEMAYRVRDVSAGVYHVMDDPMAEERQAIERDRTGDEE